MRQLHPLVDVCSHMLTYAHVCSRMRQLHPLVDIRLIGLDPSQDKVVCFELNERERFRECYAERRFRLTHTHTSAYVSIEAV